MVRSCKTRKETLDALWETYSPVAMLSDKNGGRVLRVRHKESGRDMIVREFSSPVEAYEILLPFHCRALPGIYDVISLSDGMIVFEEFIDGMTVREVMESGRYTYRGVKKVIRGVLEGLLLLHENGIIHRDVKPDNVMITPGGRVVLIDLNASRTVKDTSHAQDASSHDTTVMGTVGYAAPEQLGIAQSDERSDLYAVGVMINVMLTGLHPTVKMARGKAGRIVEKCTHIRLDKRFQSARELAEHL